MLTKLSKKKWDSILIIIIFLSSYDGGVKPQKKKSTEFGFYPAMLVGPLIDWEGDEEQSLDAVPFPNVSFSV